ncbi:fam-a protein [Plasmodium yoelii]|uniref:Fam-a protein n=1 Tax=Plasmodium yoelii TaxID=5861 RepID=A0A4V0KLY7_PLAYE|nr:fam-a protein [Plasmodium yoelii]VTZ78714.1 fam-a protein [Plasmodium yoelii]|eukprot:XP_034493499.1 fam-a protein [Plasmodium yoelii]
MNKFYIQILFFLLIISLYGNNKALATEVAPKTGAKPKSIRYTKPKSIRYTKPKSKKHEKPKSKKSYPANDNTEEIYEQNKHLLHPDIMEHINARNFMRDALVQLEYHANSRAYYKLFCRNYDYHMLFYKKKFRGHTKIQKVEYIIDDPNQYNEIINEVWDPNSDNYFYAGSVKRKIVRVYNRNLVMIQQRCKQWSWSREKYFYAIAAKYKISENKTIFVMASANIIDHNRKNNKYFENEIVESANIFQAEIDSEDDIRNGELKKMFVNLSGYIFEKRKNHIYITYVDSNDEHGSI